MRRSKGSKLAPLARAGSNRSSRDAAAKPVRRTGSDLKRTGSSGAGAGEGNSSGGAILAGAGARSAKPHAEKEAVHAEMQHTGHNHRTGVVATPEAGGAKWQFHDVLYRSEWGERDPYDVAGEVESPPPGTIDNEYGLLMEIDTPRELRDLTRSWVPSNQHAAGSATDSSKYAFGTAFHGLLERLRRRFLTMSGEQFEALIQRLRKIDGKLKSEIDRCRSATAMHANKNRDKPAYMRPRETGHMSVSDRRKLVGSHLLAVFNSWDVKASEIECRKMVETAASHGRIVLVLETLFRGIWEQTDKDGEADGDKKLEQQSSVESRRATYINVATLKMREGHADKVSALSLSDDGKTLVSADSSGAVIVWYLIDGEQVVLTGGTGRITQISTCIYQDGETTKAALDATGIIKRFKISDGTDLLIGSSDDGSVCLWDLDRDCLRLKIPHAHGDAITAAVACDVKEGKMLAGITITASEDGAIRLWDVKPMFEMLSEPLQPLQLDVEWALQKMGEAPVFAGMSRGDLIVLLHSMEARQFGPMERIVWSNSEIQAEKQNRRRDFADEEFERLRESHGGKGQKEIQAEGCKKREKNTDVLVLITSGLAIASANEILVRKFRTGDCVGGSGWIEGFFEADYNGVAKTELSGLVLHKEMYSIIQKKRYGQLLSVYLSDGLFACEWSDVSLAQRVGLASILSAEDQQALSEFSEMHGLQSKTDTGPARKLNFSSTNKGTANIHDRTGTAIAGNDSSQELGLSSQTQGQDAYDGGIGHGQSASPDDTRLCEVTTDIPPITPFSSKKKQQGNALGQHEDVDDAHDAQDSSQPEKFTAGHPSHHLCAAAQIYGRKVRGGDTWRMLAEMRGHAGVVSSLALDGKGRLISASRDMTLRIWDLRKICESVSDNSCCQTCWSGSEADKVTLAIIDAHPSNVNGHHSWVTDVAASGSVAVSVSYDSTIKVWSLRKSDMGKHLRTILCGSELHSLRPERIRITENGEFGIVCGPLGIFQVWRLIDGTRLPPILWGGLLDVPGEDLGARITNFDAISISGRAALVATCRNSDILLWNSETSGGIVEMSRNHQATRWGKSTTETLNTAVETFVGSTKPEKSLRQLVKRAVKGADEEQSVSKEDGTQDDEPQGAGQQVSDKGGRRSSGEPAVQRDVQPQEDGPVVPMPTGKIITLPGCMKEVISDIEAGLEKEHNSVKLQMKSILRHVKEKIQSEASTMKPAQSPTSPGRQADKAKNLHAKEKLRDKLWKLNKNADGSNHEDWIERLCILTSNGEFKHVSSYKSKEDEEDSGSFTTMCSLPGFCICAI